MLAPWYQGMGSNCNIYWKKPKRLRGCAHCSTFQSSWPFKTSGRGSLDIYLASSGWGLLMGEGGPEEPSSAMSSSSRATYSMSSALAPKTCEQLQQHTRKYDTPAAVLAGCPARGPSAYCGTHNSLSVCKPDVRDEGMMAKQTALFQVSSSISTSSPDLPCVAAVRGRIGGLWLKARRLIRRTSGAMFHLPP